MRRLRYENFRALGSLRPGARPGEKIEMNSTSVSADAKFLRRVFLALVGLTLATGAVAGFTTVQAMTSPEPEVQAASE